MKTITSGIVTILFFIGIPYLGSILKVSRSGSSSMLNGFLFVIGVIAIFIFIDKLMSKTKDY